MDKKKLIGTIIGVAAFIALVAGATYAWSQAALNVTGTAYNGKTMNFIVNYTKGQNITAMPPTLANSAGTSSSSTLTVKAYRTTNSAPGKMTIYLRTINESWNTLLGNGVLTYGYCSSTSATTCSSFTGTGTITFDDPNGSGSNKYQTGSNPVNRTAIVSNIDIPTTETNYNIYFWLDGAKNQGQYKNQQYAGYIEAVATQTSN